jgi:hypothetical protein
MLEHDGGELLHFFSKHADRYLYIYPPVPYIEEAPDGF